MLESGGPVDSKAVARFHKASCGKVDTPAASVAEGRARSAAKLPFRSSDESIRSI